jgi:hypothetical protein
LTAIVLLLVIITCQAALNMWFIMRSMEMVKHTTRLDTLAQEADRLSEQRIREVRDRIGALESVLASRHEASVTLLESLVTQKTGG